MTGQPRHHSLIECIANILIGYGIAVIAQVWIFPVFGITIPLRDNMRIAAVFTLISLIRSYCLRRLFNWLLVR